MFSDKVKSVRQSRGEAVSARIAFPLPAVEHSYAARIDLDRWLALRIDRRAPVRSVVFVEVVGERFLALVIDTLAARPRWLVTGAGSRLSELHAGVLGDDGRARRSLVLFAPELERSLTPVHVAREVMDIVIGFGFEECGLPSVRSAVPGQDPGDGSPGVIVDPSVVLQAQIL